MHVQWPRFVLVLVVLSSRVASKKFNYFTYDTTMVAYSTAYSACQSRGMTLPILKTDEATEEFKFYLREKMDLDRVWLGLTLPQSSNNPDDFVWADGALVTWTNWCTINGYSEPNDMDTDKCIMVRTTELTWFTRNCDSHRQQYVCQQQVARSATGAFACLPDQLPAIPPSQVLGWSSVTQCARNCLRHSVCDVMVFSSDGSCALYPTEVQLNETTTTSSSEKQVCQKMTSQQ